MNDYILHSNLLYYPMALNRLWYVHVDNEVSKTTKLQVVRSLNCSCLDT